MAVKNDPKTNAKKVIDVLNKARSMELFAIAQYMQQHYKLADDNYTQLAAGMRKIAIDEMRHAEDLAERICEINGVPTQEHADKAKMGQDVYTIFPFDSNIELDTLMQYAQFAAICRECGDVVSARLFERISEDEQKHQTYFDDTATHIKQLDKSYLAAVSGKDFGEDAD